MRIYLRCCIETDIYAIGDFERGATVMVSPMGPDGALPFVSVQTQRDSVDELSDQIILKNPK